MYRSFFFSDHCIKQIDSMLPSGLPRAFSVTDHRGRQNVVNTSVTHSQPPTQTFLGVRHAFLSHVGQERVTWNLIC